MPEFKLIRRKPEDRVVFLTQQIREHEREINTLNIKIGIVKGMLSDALDEIEKEK